MEVMIGYGNSKEILGYLGNLLTIDNQKIAEVAVKNDVIEKYSEVLAQ